MIVIYKFSFLLFVVWGVNAECPPRPYNTSCAFGYESDVDGCPTCKCINSCTFMKCRSGYYCYSQPNGAGSCCSDVLCRSCPYGYTSVLDINGCPTCKCQLCQEPKCPCTCPLGYKLDRNGCKTCECNDPCDKYFCPDGEHCVSDYVACTNNTFCGLQAQCVPTCPEFKCDQYCIYGYEKDCNDCPICKCREPCNGVACPKYHQCVVERVYCYKPPCPDPQPICQSVCDPLLLLMKGENPVNCDPNVENSCGSNAKCVLADKELKEYVCCQSPLLELQ